LGDYLQAGLRKGVPSLFNSVKSLYKCKDRTQIIEDVVVGYYNSLKETGKLPNQDVSFMLSLGMNVTTNNNSSAKRNTNHPLMDTPLLGEAFRLTEELQACS